MRRKLAGLVGVWLLTGAALVAADFWEEKDFTTWSAQEVQEILDRLAVGEAGQAARWRAP